MKQMVQANSNQRCNKQLKVLAGFVVEFVPCLCESGSISSLEPQM